MRSAGRAREAQAAEAEQRTQAEDRAVEAERKSVRAKTVLSFIREMLSLEEFRGVGDYTVVELLDAPAPHPARARAWRLIEAASSGSGKV